MPGPRHRARVIAFQALCEIDSTAHDEEGALGHLLADAGLSEPQAAFARELVHGVRQSLGILDDHIRRLAPAWPLHQMAVVDRNVLRLAIYEMLLDNRVPVRAAINEAVELAKVFGSDSSARFINGVLGAASSLADQ